MALNLSKHHFSVSEYERMGETGVFSPDAGNYREDRILKPGEHFTSATVSGLLLDLETILAR